MASVTPSYFGPYGPGPNLPACESCGHTFCVCDSRSRHLPSVARSLSREQSYETRSEPHVETMVQTRIGVSEDRAMANITSNSEHDNGPEPSLQHCDCRGKDSGLMHTITDDSSSGIEAQEDSHLAGQLPQFDSSSSVNDFCDFHGSRVVNSALLNTITEGPLAYGRNNDHEGRIAEMLAAFNHSFIEADTALPTLRRPVVLPQDDLLYDGMINPAEPSLPLVEKQVPCPHCGRLLKDSKSVTRHIARQHNLNVEYFKCQEDDCFYTTQKRADLRRHARSIHPIPGVDPSPHKCYICGVGFSRRDNLSRHITTCVPKFRNSSTEAYAEALSTPIERPIPSPDVLVSWPSPNSRQVQREGALRAIEKFEEPESTSSPVTLAAFPIIIAAGISFASNFKTGELDADNGRELDSESEAETESEIESEDEVSTNEHCSVDWAQQSVDTHAGALPKKERKRRTQADKEASHEKKRQKRERSNPEGDGRNTDRLKTSNKSAFNDYNYKLPCPYYKYDPVEHVSCSECSFRSIAHLCRHLDEKHDLYPGEGYIAHAPIFSESNKWPWPNVAAAVCRTCWATFETRNQLVEHVDTECSSKDLIALDNFDLADFVTLPPEANEKTKKKLMDIWTKWTILKLAFCDNFFPRLHEWDRLHSQTETDQPSEAATEEHPIQPLVNPPSTIQGCVASSPSVLENLLRDQASHLDLTSVLHAACDREQEAIERAYAAAQREHAAIEREHVALGREKAAIEREQAALVEISRLRAELARHQTTSASEPPNTPAKSIYDLNGVMARDTGSPFSSERFAADISYASLMPNFADAQGIAYAPHQAISGTVDPKVLSVANDSGYGGGEEDLIGWMSQEGAQWNLEKPKSI